MSQTPTPDASWKKFPSWLFFTLLVVGPPVTLVTFARDLAQDHPLLIALVVVGYEAILCVFRFVGKIWQQLEEPLTTHLAQWLTVRAREMISHSYRRYCQYLIYEHQIFDIKGLSTRTAHDLELEQVFVDLRMAALPSHQASVDPLRFPEVLQGTHTPWDYLASIDLANPHLVILGAPGSGKTTLLKHLALTLAHPQRDHRRRNLRHAFPILLFLKDHAGSIVDNPTFSLEQAIEDHVQRKWQPKEPLPASWISRFLKRGKCLVLLDGLDEVADRTTRKLVVDWVERQMIANGQNRFVLTSRPYGYRDMPLDGVTTLEVQPFTSEQVKQFVSNWYLANELKSWGKDDPGVRLRAREGTNDLLRRLRQAPALLALTVNPLLLTMIATVHRYRSSLPGKRIDLYVEICEVFLGKRYEARGIEQDLSPAQKQQVLQPLAYALMQQGVREIPRNEVEIIIAPTLILVSRQSKPADFLQMIENTSGLLLERNPGMYSFAHLTFQEYLAAVYIKEEGLESVLVAQVSNSWWHETIRLYCAQMDATSLIQACLAANPLTADALALAFECDDEKLKIQPQVQEQLNIVLETGREDPDPQRRHIVAEAILTRRIRQMKFLRQERYIDNSLITCAEYQLFIDENRAHGNYRQPDHWTNFTFPTGLGNTAVLGVRRSDAQAFCDWLTDRDKEGWRYRLPRRGEWSLEERKKRGDLGTKKGYWVEGEPFFVWIEGKPLQQQFFPGRAPDFARGLDLNRALDLDRALDLVRDLARDLDLVRDLDLARDLARNLNRTLPLALNLARNLNRTLSRNLDLNRDLNRAGELAHTLFLARASTRDRALILKSNLTHATDLYIALFLFQERIVGHFPAHEGILLVKEHQQTSGGSEV